MAADIQQSITSGYYDTTQQHIMAMSQMMGFENYNTQSYPHGVGVPKEFNEMKNDNMMFHPLFASQFSAFANQLPNSPSRGSPSIHSNNKKKPQPVPEDQKDEGYRERRRRNNEAARKSRESRKKTEDMNGRQLEATRNENFILKQRVFQLEAEIARLRCEYTHAVSQMRMMSSNSQNPPSF